ncbi:MAG: tail fiber domain-containing protein [Hyphomicrobiaceae bacterium]
MSLSRGFRLAGAVAAMVTALTPALAVAGDVDEREGIGAASPMPDTYSRPGLEVSGFVTDDGGAGEVNVILPLAMRGSHALLFLGGDAKLIGGSSDYGDNAYNVGAYLGYRALLDNGSGVLGLWLGADTLRGRYGHTFQRFIAGAEYFGPRLIARINGFAPFDDASDPWTEVTRTTTTTAQRITTTTITSTYDEKTPSGVDAEAGLRFALPALASGGRQGELRAFAGVYDYVGLKEDGGNVIGGRGRLELDLYPFDAAPNTRLTLEASYSDDAHYGDQLAGGVRLSISLGEPATRETAIYSGSLKDTGGSLKEGDPGPSLGYGGGKDLFQPVRRNNNPVTVRRLKSQTIRTAIENRDTEEPTDPPPATTGYTLATVCGGPTAQIITTASDPSANFQDFMDPLVQGQEIAFESLTSTGIPLDIATWVDGSNQTLAQLLASSPASIVTTVSIPPALVTPTLELSPTLTFQGFPVGPGIQLTAATLTVDNSTCTLDIEFFAPAASDRRLKRDIELLATLDDGTKLYSFRYIESFDSSGQTYVGVMAQDIRPARPDAIVTMANGYYAVRYNSLGLRMTSFEAWQREGLGAVVIDQGDPAR